MSNWIQDPEAETKHTFFDSLFIFSLRCVRVFRILCLIATMRFQLLSSLLFVAYTASPLLVQADRDLQQQDNQQSNRTIKTVNIAGLFHLDHYSWTEEVFNFTMSLINDHDDGWHDDIFDDSTKIDWVLEDSGCDRTMAARAYWKARDKEAGTLHGIVGCRCSGASSAVATIASLDEVTQVSPVSTSAKLSDKQEFPYFARLAAPDNEKGEVGAMVAMLRAFGWQRVMVLATDTQFTSDYVTEFQRLWTREDTSADGKSWKGRISYSSTIVLNDDDENTINIDSVKQALQGAPTDDPTDNSRIILLVAHSQHAYPILKIANEEGFQPDTIWAGPDWVGHPLGGVEWLPEYPGFVGIAPYQNRDSHYTDYLRRLQDRQRLEGRPVWDALPDYTAHNLIDSILALTKALSAVSPLQWLNATMVTHALRQLSFHGVSGEVSFSDSGDRKNPQFSVINLQREEGLWSWVNVGEVNLGGKASSTVSIDIEKVCFPVIGCSQLEAPSDRYPIDPVGLATWVIAVLVVVAALFLGTGFLYFRSRRHITRIEKKLKIDSELDDIGAQVEAAKKRQSALIRQRAQLQGRPDKWTDTLNDDQVLVEVLPESEEYWDVAEKLTKTMSDAHISKLWRVQNLSLFTYYSFHKDRLEMHNVSPNERDVWHGTSNVDPSVIFEDRQDGFMMQFSQQGFWG